MPAPPAREHSVETIRRNSEVMGNLRKLMVANRGVSIKRSRPRIIITDTIS